MTAGISAIQVFSDIQLFTDFFFLLKMKKKQIFANIYYFLQILATFLLCFSFFFAIQLSVSLLGIGVLCTSMSTYKMQLQITPLIHTNRSNNVIHIFLQQQVMRTKVKTLQPSRLFSFLASTSPKLCPFFCTLQTSAIQPKVGTSTTAGPPPYLRNSSDRCVGSPDAFSLCFSGCLVQMHGFKIYKTLSVYLSFYYNGIIVVDEGNIICWMKFQLKEIHS